MSSKTILNIITLGLVLFGLIFFIVGAVLGAVENNKKKRCTEEVAAVVIENRTVRSTSRNHGQSITYSPVFRYTYNGTDYETQTGYSSSPAVFSVGEKTTLFVDPDSPKTIYCPKLKIGKILSVIFSIIGAAFIIVPVIVNLVVRKRLY